MTRDTIVASTSVLGRARDKAGPFFEILEGRIPHANMIWGTISLLKNEAAAALLTHRFYSFVKKDGTPNMSIVGRGAYLLHPASHLKAI